jgi:hypothetical protein
MMFLNRKQDIYLKNILTNIKSGKTFYNFLTGGQGTGKSRLIQAIFQSVTRYYNPSDKENVISVLICAYTGKAAFNLSAMTIHSLFHLPKGNQQMKNLSGTILKRLTEKLANLKLIIIDEISLVSSLNLLRISQRLQQIKNSDLPFGDVSMLVVGDFNQLPPVGGDWAFQMPRNIAYLQLVTFELWQIFKIYELDEVMRQRNDYAFATALNNLGNNGLYGLTDEQIRLLNTRFVPENEIPADAMVLFFEKRSVKEFNRRRIGTENVIENLAVDIPVGKKSNTPRAIQFAKSCFDEEDMEKTANLPRSIQFKIGIKYSITKNLAVTDGIANGVVGVLKHIVRTQRVRSTKPLIKRVWLDFNNNDVGENLKQKCKEFYEKDLKDFSVQESNKWIPFLLEQNKINYLKGEDFHVERMQFPLIEFTNLKE